MAAYRRVDDLRSPDCLYTGISSGPNARCRVWEAFTFFTRKDGNCHRRVHVVSQPSEWYRLFMGVCVCSRLQPGHVVQSGRRNVRVLSGGNLPGRGGRAVLSAVSTQTVRSRNRRREEYRRMWRYALRLVSLSVSYS